MAKLPVRNQILGTSAGGIGHVSDVLRIYLVAEDVAPNYRNLGNECTGLNSSAATIDAVSCTQHGTFFCSQKETSSTDASNQQSGGFVEWNYAEGHASGQPNPNSNLLRNSSSMNTQLKVFHIRFATQIVS